jgi:aryl-alcohol dehydrogenase-like predicted oxidoreductase
MPVAASVSSRSRDAAAGTQRAADPGTGSTGHLRENLAAEHVAVDEEALRELAGVGAWPS